MPEHTPLTEAELALIARDLVPASWYKPRLLADLAEACRERDEAREERQQEAHRVTAIGLRLDATRQLANDLGNALDDYDSDHAYMCRGATNKRCFQCEQRAKALSLWASIRENWT